VTFSDFLRTATSSAKTGTLLIFNGRRNYSKLAWLFFLVLSPLAVAQKSTSGTNTGPTTKLAEVPIQYDGVPYVSGDRRDPFLNPKLFHKNAAPHDQEMDRGIPPPGIAGTYIAKAALEGISIGNGRRIAIVRAADSRAYFLKEGDRLFDGYLKSIKEDSVIFVHETKMRSGKVMAQDITKRLRTP
jgi:hypothetical protein